MLSNASHPKDSRAIAKSPAGCSSCVLQGRGELLGCFQGSEELMSICRVLIYRDKAVKQLASLTLLQVLTKGKGNEGDWPLYPLVLGLVLTLVNLCSGSTTHDNTFVSTPIQTDDKYFKHRPCPPLHYAKKTPVCCHWPHCPHQSCEPGYGGTTQYFD